MVEDNLSFANRSPSRQRFETVDTSDIPCLEQIYPIPNRLFDIAKEWRRYGHSFYWEFATKMDAAQT